MTGWPARIGLILGALLLGWLSVAVSVANYYAASSPAKALWLWPGHAVAQARVAEALVDSVRPGAVARNRQAVAQAAREAALALQRNPTLAAPARIMALGAGLRRDQRLTDRLIDYSVRMSRRDIPTQFLLLERRVQADDVRGALAHFGISLRVAPGTQTILFPVLSGALSQANLREPIADLVSRGDAWRSEFLYHAASNADPASAAALFAILARKGTPPAAPHLHGLIERLVTARNFPEAARLYALVDRNWRLDNAASQLDGAFTRIVDLPPFGWELNQSNAARGPRPDQSDNNSLQVSLPPTDEEWAARKLLLIAPGRYRLTGAYGMMDGGSGRVRFEIACSRGGTVVATVTGIVNRPTGTLDGMVDIPATCGQQWLTILTTGAGSSTAGRLWLDDLRLTRAAG